MWEERPFWEEIADILTGGIAWLVSMALFLAGVAVVFLVGGFVLDLIGVL